MSKQPKNNQPLHPDELDDILIQLSLPITDDEGLDIKNVYEDMSLAALVTDWLYHQLKQPNAPVIDYDEPDLEEIVNYLEGSIPSYIWALCQVVYNWDKVAGTEKG